MLLLLARVGLGVVLTAHGCQKFFEWGMAGTTESFGQMGAPLPGLSAWIAAIIEFFGGILLIAGAFTSVVGILVALNMLGAWLIAHVSAGTIFVAKGGPELVIALGCGGLLLAAAGAGQWSVDALLARRQRAPGTAGAAGATGAATPTAA
ncbi:DoxX family protein [Corynebacterium uropygiale]|uniref:DoxX family protein n=1 Tax=Corynebacterium uropygiale TaxID=1775911 RepID=A0A9X1QRX4_9CORY|nr:DoxX family protein [Corynebacterium uropygiale]